MKKLGAIGAELGAVVAFFDETWSQLSPNLSTADQAWLLNSAAYYLRALGRLTEAVEPMRVSLEHVADAENWGRAATAASNLSELEVTLGQLHAAVADGRRAIEFADRSGENDWQNFIRARTIAADALHQAGESAEPGALFVGAERMQAQMQPQFPLLYSLQGFRYGDLLLAPAERAVWRFGARPSSGPPDPGGERPPEGGTPNEEAFAVCAEAERRAASLFAWRMPSDSILDVALDHLTQARAALYRVLLTPDDSQSTIRSTVAPDPGSGLSSAIETALAKLRAANSLDDLPMALLTAALYYATLGHDPDEARRLLDEAQVIAERAPCRCISRTSTSTAPLSRQDRTRRGSRTHRKARLRPPPRGTRRCHRRPWRPTHGVKVGARMKPQNRG